MTPAKIFIIEDEEDILRLLEINLCKAGYRVNCFKSGEEGLKMMKECRPDLVLLDLMLPGLDGFEISRIMRDDSATASIPIVMVTARGEDADIAAGFEMGAAEYIVKPFQMKNLIERIEKVLRRNAA